MGEQAKPNPHLHRIDAGVVVDNVRIRYVKPADIDAHSVPAAHHVRAQSNARGEVERGAQRRDGIGGEQAATADLEKWRDVPARSEIPLHRKRIEAAAVYRGVMAALVLEHQERGNDVEGILEPPVQQARAVRVRQHPAISRAQIPLGDGRNASVDRYGAAGARPHFKFVTALDGAIDRVVASVAGRIVDRSADRNRRRGIVARGRLRTHRGRRAPTRDHNQCRGQKDGLHRTSAAASSALLAGGFPARLASPFVALMQYEHLTAAASRASCRWQIVV